MKKILFVFLVVTFLIGLSISADAAKNDDLIINDNRIFDLGNKYTSLVSALYEEETARIGLDGYHYSIGKRDRQSEIKKSKAITSLLEAIYDVEPKNLSPYARADYYTLKELVGLKNFNSNIVNQFSLDPMWYLEPLDTIYEILLKDFLPDQDRLSYAMKRLEMMPEVLAQAEDNLTNPSELSLRVAIEKINAENENMQSFTALVKRIYNNKLSKEQIKQLSQRLTTALNKYKTFLQNKLKSGNFSDFRIGDENYEYLYEEVYSVPTRYGKVSNLLRKNLEEAEADLMLTIQSMKEPPAEENEEEAEQTVTPNDYYTLAAKYKNAPEYDKVLRTYSDEVKESDQFFVSKKLFPTISLPLVITPAPPVLRSMPSQVTVYPPVPLAEKQSGDILVSLPKKLNLNKKEFNLKYNYGKIKFNAAEFITPGQSLIYSVEPVNSSLLYKLSNDIFYIHGWMKYALDTAYQNGFFDYEEDKLNYHWFNYKKAVYALVDYELQTKNWDYNVALEFIKQSGIKEAEAQAELDYLALRPFDAVSYIIGAQEFNRLKNKYKKKQGKDFDILTFNTKVLSLGRIPLITLEDSLEKAYAKKEVDSLFNMTYF